eukprot:TRINITY_DN2292_c0_g1_i2.p2 TRINITY_DN2292_c0_g1~~TRINITY_DN2292_c0_g1_i2.p2  ORF type:complete len:211 (+),score=41.50 TRINITY_DN2292_c0_g1_i2:84-716(+)
MADAVTLADVHGAAARIRKHVRRTPIVAATNLMSQVCSGSLYLKLENLQLTGSFKSRGAMNTVLQLSSEAQQRGLVTASGGNHGLGVAAAGRAVGVPVKIFISTGVAAAKEEKLQKWGASTCRHGSVWDESNEAALQCSVSEGMTYVHPFAAVDVVAGQGTIGLEIMEDLPDVDVVVVAIGGGGLIAGVALAIKKLRPYVASPFFWFLFL